MPAAARAIRFPAHVYDAPMCAQCRRKMTLLQIKRRAFEPRTDKFICVDCGLIDKIVRRRDPIDTIFRRCEA
jgi:hypothetical protein